MLGIESACQLITQAQHFTRNDTQSVTFKTRVNLSDNILADSIRFEDGQGTFNSHGLSPKKHTIESAALYGL